MPPQFGKSEIVSRHLPAWLLGHDTTKKIILASYSSHLADTFNRSCQKIMKHENYYEVFPTRVQRKYLKRKKETQNFIETDFGGYLYSVGVGGSTTGRAADVIIIDDPIKDHSDASSPTMRRRRMEWFNSVAQTRLSKDGHIILMHTRWHEADLAGELLSESELDPDATKWEVISLPALGNPQSIYKHPLDLRDKGDPLWPEMKGGRDKMEQIKRDVGERTWAALYQQSPMVDGGNIIKSNWIHFYSELPFKAVNLRHHNSVISWDMSFKDTGSSFVVGVCIVQWEQHFYVMDLFRRKVDIVDTMSAVNVMHKRFPFATILIEDKANGPAVMSLLKKSIPGIISVSPDASKDERLHAVAPLFEQGLVHFPMNAVWTKDAVHELQSFPNSANDDIVDAISQGLRHFSAQRGIQHLKASTKW